MIDDKTPRGWRCFHCGDYFTEDQAAHAREHFGRDEGQTPVCLMRIPGEGGLLAALRKAQDELAEWRAENAPLMRAIESQSADYEQRLIREEEKGYARGLKDYSQVEAERDRLRAELAEQVKSGESTLWLLSESAKDQAEVESENKRLRAELAAARAEEREACAAVAHAERQRFYDAMEGADGQDFAIADECGVTAARIAAAIRARGGASEGGGT